MSMNSIDLHNYLSLHRREVIRLAQTDEVNLSQKMRLTGYARALANRLDEMAGRIYVKFEIDDTNQQAHNVGGSDQEPDSLTVGNYKHAQAEADRCDEAGG